MKRIFAKESFKTAAAVAMFGGLILGISLIITGVCLVDSESIVPSLVFLGKGAACCLPFYLFGRFVV